MMSRNSSRSSCCKFLRSSNISKISKSNIFWNMITLNVYWIDQVEKGKVGRVVFFHPPPITHTLFLIGLCCELRLQLFICCQLWHLLSAVFLLFSNSKPKWRAQSNTKNKIRLRFGTSCNTCWVGKFKNMIRWFQSTFNLKGFPVPFTFHRMKQDLHGFICNAVVSSK